MPELLALGGIRSCVSKHSKIKVIVAFGFCALLVGGVAWLFRARHQRAYASCITLLKQIEGAKATWALEHKKQNDDTPTWADLLGPGLYIADRPVCPQGGIYTLGKVAEYPGCSHPGPGHSLVELLRADDATNITR